MSDSPSENPFSGLPFFGDMAKAMSSQGPLQWDVARQTAMMTALSGNSTEPNVDPAARVGIEQLVPIADLHVRNHTGLDTASAGKLPQVVVVNRSMWVHHTLESYKPRFNELATSLSGSPIVPTDALDINQDDPMMTMMASLNAYDYLLFATSATVRPKVEAVLAQELGLDEGWRSDNLCCTVIRCRN